MRQKWKERSKKDKILLISKLIISIFILMAASLQLAHIWPDALYVTVPLLGILQLLEAALNWKTNRDNAVLSLMVAVFIGFTVIAVYCI